MHSTILEAVDHVLSTLEKDGSRRWLRPKLIHGHWLTLRRVVAYLLIAVFTLIPFLKIDGKPAFLLDIVRRKFTLFDYTFLPTDSLLLAVFAVGSLISIFLLTAFFLAEYGVVGRVRRPSTWSLSFVRSSDCLMERWDAVVNPSLDDPLRH